MIYSMRMHIFRYRLQRKPAFELRFQQFLKIAGCARLTDPTTAEIVQIPQERRCQVAAALSAASAYCAKTKTKRYAIRNHDSTSCFATCHLGFTSDLTSQM